MFLGVSGGQLGGMGVSIQLGQDQGGIDNTANLKGKCNNLNETLRQLTENLNVHKKEV